MPPVPPEEDEDEAMPDDEEDAGDDAEGEGDEEEPPQAAAPQVIATILKNGDGTYQLISGDEPEEGEEGPEGAPGAGGEGEEPQSQGESFDSVGALLKGVLDLVKQSDEGGSGDQGGDADFQQGFDQESQKPAIPVPATGAQ